ncbi:MAG TPA: FtsQ-type POTRA domain-containing protein [Oscillospiraceae bacterium]|nr:FtsQ-type POTRA domain-containing protein [Oscillospiraceae bacterium]HPK35872.1 FtsQ-type POTRA domain-containing protein [Oscillospiraceae bacterium]HPR76581.1 FtsQ-type POTRA domain-containing protein [Oscillospiraceae bacterium]
MAEVRNIKKRKKRRVVPTGSQPPKRRRKGKRGLYAVPIFLIALIVGTILCCTVFFKIEMVTVEGNTRYTADQIIAASGIETGENLLRLKKDQIIEGITDNLCYAETVTIKKQLPNEVIITVSEPQHTAVVTLGASNLLLISGKGRVLEYGYSGAGIRYEGLTDLTIENGYIATAEIDVLARLSAINAAFEDGGFGGITAVGTTSATVNYAVWADRIKIQLGSDEDLTQKVKFAKYFIENELGENETGVADVSAGKQLYFDPGPWTGSEPESAE